MRIRFHKQEPTHPPLKISDATVQFDPSLDEPRRGSDVLDHLITSSRDY